MKICSYAALISFILIAILVIIVIAIWGSQGSYVEKNTTFSLNKNKDLSKYYYKYFGYKGNFFIPVMGEDNYYILDIGEIVKENGLHGRLIASSPYDGSRIVFLFENEQKNNGEYETTKYMVYLSNKKIKELEKSYEVERIIFGFNIENGTMISELEEKLGKCSRRRNYWYDKKNSLFFLNCGPVDAKAKKNPEKDETFGIVDLSTGNKIFEQSGNIIWNNSFIDPENVLYTYEGVLYTYNALKNEGHEIKLDVSEGARMRKDTLIDRIHFLDNQLILVRYTRKKDWFSHLLFGYGYDYKYYYYLGEYESSDTIVIKEQLKGKPFIKDWLITDIEAME